MLNVKLCAKVILISDGIWTYMLRCWLKWNANIYDHTWWWISMMKGMNLLWQMKVLMEICMMNVLWIHESKCINVQLTWLWIYVEWNQYDESTYCHVQDMDREQRYDMIPVVMCKTWTGNRVLMQYLLSCARHG